MPHDPFIVSLLAGATAGTAVDTILFPLDTLKTRLQAKQGFQQSGGFHGVYKGLASAVAGSAPAASLFFVTYETLKYVLGQTLIAEENRGRGGFDEMLVHMLAATGGEVAACLVRVPTEIIKQRMQAGHANSIEEAIAKVLRQEGVFGFYRGYTTTMFREIPFTCIQFPLYESLKLMWHTKYGRDAYSWEMALLGSLSGGFAAFLTTPLDVVKTRVMLAERHSQKTSYLDQLFILARQEGMRGLFAGVVPRTIWISIGGSIFFGVYEASRSIFRQYFS